MRENPTPSFNRPPVIERVLGIQFAPIDGWVVPHFGLYWDLVRSDYPGCQVHPAIASLPDGTEVKIELMSNPELRCWFISKSGGELIQVQADRFLMNWRRLSETDYYPRYRSEVQAKFHFHWRLFQDFLKTQSLSEPRLIQCEVTYVNHIPKGDGWTVPADWSDVFTVCNKLSTEGLLPPPESRRFALNYTIPNGVGSLRTSVTRAIRKSDNKDVIQFELNARGRPSDLTGDGVRNWLDDAHDWVVRAFAELTTRTMHERWERET